MNTNNHLHFPFTPVGRNVTIENTANGKSATLEADGRVERSICDKVVLQGGHTADFQESLDTLSIRGLLARLKQENSEALKDRVYLSQITKETLGQGWSGRALPSSDGSLNTTFQSEGQRLRLYGPADNRHLNLLTIHDDSEKRTWAHLLSGRLDRDYNLIPERVQEQANVTFLD